jgi:hypothetical protein
MLKEYPRLACHGIIMIRQLIAELRMAGTQSTESKDIVHDLSTALKYWAKKVPTQRHGDLMLGGDHSIRYLKI